jgi:hypothetical protein
MKEPDAAAPVVDGIVLGAAGAVVEELGVPGAVEGDAGACAKAGAANIVATRHAAICVLSIVNSFW